MKWYLPIVLVAVLGGRAQGEVTQDEDGRGGTISFKPPTLNDEEYHSMHMPPDFKCDACNAVAHQITTVFNDRHSKRKSLNRLPESDIFELIDQACSINSYEHYGVKEVKNVKRLSGPGLEAQEVPGIMQGGGKWPDRLAQMCNRYAEELGEETIYDLYHMDNTVLPEVMCKSPAEPRLTDVCTTPAPRAKKTRKMKEDL